jgi:FAD/FMN-containing dehydrogenase
MTTSHTWTNWVGNQTFTPRRIASAANEADVQREVAEAARNGYGVRTFGTGHSFTPIIETDGVLLDTAPLRGIVNIDPARQLVTALPKTTVGDFGEPLWAQGLALGNQGDIDTQAIAGAVATATHGSGTQLQCFSAMLDGARFVDGMGNLVEVSRTRNINADVLPALQTSIGLLGVMTQMTMRVVPAYELHARTAVLAFDEMLARFDEYLTQFRSFTFFWCPTDASAALYNLAGAKADDCALRLFSIPTPDAQRENLPAGERIDRAYRVYPMVYDPNFHEMEYFLPLAQAHDILREMRKLMRRWLPLSIYPLEIRNVAADDVWLSPNYQRASLVVSISGQPGTDYWPYLRACDSLFAEFRGRPHWGKLHFMSADRLARLFPRYTDFVRMRQRFDPLGTFLNGHTRSLFT